ncbi:16S rRNA (cytosine(967)-C(5))-methyltransferase RsmB [Aestuariirhabdus litorea]|uniref:16S rRNA (cytosine(967)-C(5))-methyltransferase n=1 Tax=Aestuariirhabdus litorea TaxID=2528527 RepID=A0A3P3VP39_9GAMM|nr:16S rRNA (cytosine(967)-C(5))-methyltransferase RsmB [Aestuariirhabdus litorea]RRJ82583.1 16S rRNA (cytosine(967)-C(5))-methyltransferase RsmB [Aestuariirhabdus litorea]RWW92741.1 16S rRNA (cytosine(967)-C(5))-methyltransferase RsmB [Endozoicomonadaceae bacterium GTF-13]
MSRPVRAQAALALQQVLTHGRSLSQVLPEALSEVDPGQQPLLSELCYGTCRWFFTLRSSLSILLDTPLREKDSDIEALLLLGLYQLRSLKIPAHAVLSETVAACTQLDKAWARKLVNAVLRRYQRESAIIEEQLTGSEVPATAHPKWMIKQWQRDWAEQWRAIADANNQRPPMTLRVNALRGSCTDYLKQLDQMGIGAHSCLFSPSAITLDAPCDPLGLPGFTEGASSVQDEAAQLSGFLLHLSPGHKVLDACAAPGGKSGHLLETEPAIQLTSLEVDPTRAQRITQNLERLQLNARLIVGDATRPDQWWDGQLYDRILLDAPCSGTGVIRRHPDIKVLRRREDIPQLVALQQQIIEAVWPLLKEGGLLLYATCSTFKAENSDQVEGFLQRYREAEEITIEAPWGIACQRGRQLLPQPGGHDGFYYALLRKGPALS